MLLYVLVYVALCGGCFGYKPTWYPSYGQTYHHPHHSYYHHSQDYDYDEHHRRPQVHQVIPSDVMVDVINDLGLKLLAIHNENNEDNNIALSPYGALGMLIVLGEGLQGEALHEIQHAAHLPTDLSVVRVGLRDIHRHLKSYFIPKEGFLAGLTLNHDNVTLNSNYEDILKFYGFDIGSFNNALYPDPLTTEKPDSTTLMMAKEDEMSTDMSTTTESITTESIANSSPIMTTEAMPETTTISQKQTTREPIVAEMEPTTTPTTELPTSTTMQESTKVSETTTEISPLTTTTLPQSTTMEQTTATMPTDSTTTVGETTSNVPTTSEVPSTTLTPDSVPTSTTEIPTSTLAESTTVEVVTDATELTTTNESPTTEDVASGLIKENLVLLTTQNPEIATSEPLVTTPDYFDITTENFFTTPQPVFTDEIPNYPNYYENYVDSNTTDRTQRKARSVVDYLIAKYHDNSYDTPLYDYHHQHRRPTYIPDEPLTFLAHGKYRESKINFMVYDTVLPFLYVPHLNALALSFPLDNTKYYLLLLLPLDPQGIDDLICDLRLNGSLKNIIKNLKLTHVKATIPSFTLKGFVVLTPTLQKLGIRKVFEPRHADFSPMTNEKEIYVTNIEQAVTVTIRNYVDIGNLPNYRNLYQFKPVHFKADHPFLYFVIDADLHVALMAGKIVNPLNSRIR